MSSRLLFRLEARLDIEEAVLWYEDQRAGLGDRLATELNDLLIRIERFPLQFPDLGDGVRRGLLHQFPYAVYFLLEEDAVIVLAVLHQRRDPEAWKRRI
jgi:plasmid stabilization system protein ParE